MLWLLLLVRIIFPFKLFQFEIQDIQIIDNINVSIGKTIKEYIIKEENIFNNKISTPYNDKLYNLVKFIIPFCLLFIYVLKYRAESIRFTRYDILNSERLKKIITRNGYKYNMCQYFISDTIVSPAIFGILKPKLVLPMNIDLKQNKYIDYIIIHEFTHLLERHSAINLIGRIVCCLYWYNPLIWFSYIIFNLDMEVSADQAVIKKLGNAHKSNYINSLLNIETENIYNANIKEMNIRIDYIKKFGQSSKYITLFLFSTSILSLFISLTDFKLNAINLVTLNRQGRLDIKEIEKVNFNPDGPEYYCEITESKIDAAGNAIKNIVNFNSAVVFTNESYAFMLNENDLVDVILEFDYKDFSQDMDFGYVKNRKYTSIESFKVDEHCHLKNISYIVKEAGEYYFVIVNYSSDSIMNQAQILIK